MGFTFFGLRLQVHDLGSVEGDPVIVEVNVHVIAIRTQKEREGEAFLRPYRPRRAVTGELEISGAKTLRSCRPRVENTSVTRRPIDRFRFGSQVAKVG